MTREEFEEKEQFMNLLHTYLQRVNNKKPEIGQYDVQLPEKHIPEIAFDKMQSREQFYDEDLLDDQDREGDVLILDPRRPWEIEKDKLKGIDMAKLAGRGDDFTEFEEVKDEIVLFPNKDYVKKKQGIGGAIPLDKQVGRPLPDSIDDDELFVVFDPTPAVLNDPMKPRVRGVSIEKQQERFKYEPEELLQDELIIPSDVKPLPKEKVLFRMEKGTDRFPSVEKKPNWDLADIADDAAFKGTDMVDMDKAYKAKEPKVIVLADFSKQIGRGTSKEKEVEKE